MMLARSLVLTLTLSLVGCGHRFLPSERTTLRHAKAQARALLVDGVAPDGSVIKPLSGCRNRGDIEAIQGEVVGLLSDLEESIETESSWSVFWTSLGSELIPWRGED